MVWQAVQVCQSSSRQQTATAWFMALSLKNSQQQLQLYKIKLKSCKVRSFLLAFLVLENIVYAISLDKRQASSYAVNLLFAALSVFTFVRCRKNKYGYGTTFIYLVSGRHPPLIVLIPLLMAAFLCFFCSRTRSCPPSAFAILAFPTGSLHILRAPCTCYCCCCCCTICLCCLAAPVPQLFIFIDWNVSQAVKYRSLICSCLARSHETTNSCSCTVCAQLPAACRLPPAVYGQWDENLLRWQYTKTVWVHIELTDSQEVSLKLYMKLSGNLFS